MRLDGQRGAAKECGDGRCRATTHPAKGRRKCRFNKHTKKVERLLRGTCWWAMAAPEHPKRAKAPAGSKPLLAPQRAPRSSIISLKSSKRSRCWALFCFIMLYRRGASAARAPVRPWPLELGSFRKHLAALDVPEAAWGAQAPASLANAPDQLCWLGGRGSESLRVLERQWVLESA